jgi:hypothetical protein
MIDSEHTLLLLVLLAMSWIIRAWRRRRRGCPPEASLRDPTDVIAGALTQELVRVLTELRPDPSPGQTRETVNVVLIRYESERRAVDSG